MPIYSCIIRFPNNHSRELFKENLTHTELAEENVEFGEFLPDVIVHNVSEEHLETLKKIADPEAKFFEDIQFDTLAPKKAAAGSNE